MKKFLIIFIFSLSANSLCDDIHLSADLWCPYSCEPKSDKPGFMVEITKLIFEEAGHKVDYKLVNWARAIEETRNGKHTAIVGASRADAPDFITPDIAIGHSSNFFWVENTNIWKYKDNKSLVGKKIGVINSYSYGNVVDLEVQKKNSSYIIVSGDDALLKMIRMTAAKRLGAFVENPFVLEYTLKDLPEFKNKFIPASKNITEDTDLFVSFTPGNPKSKSYTKLLSEGMIKLRKNGKLKTILGKYGLKDWK